MILLELELHLELNNNFKTLCGINTMKVNASVKKFCRKCKIIRRNRILRVICEDRRHKQRQG